jgi:hypothetical protein
MSYRLSLVTPSRRGDKDFGENILFDNLPTHYELYIFYFSGPMRDSDLEDKLKAFGNDAGKNLFVNIATLKDPKYKLLATQFEIGRLPTIVMTGVERYASLKRGEYFSTAFVRIDNRELLRDVGRALECVGNLFRLFISGKVSEALQEAKTSERKAMIAKLTTSLLSLLLSSLS